MPDPDLKARVASAIRETMGGSHLEVDRSADRVMAVVEQEVESLRGYDRYSLKHTAAERDEARAETERLREAISDALADLTPGISPHGLLDAALRQKEETDA